MHEKLINSTGKIILLYMTVKQQRFQIKSNLQDCQTKRK